MYIWHIKKSIYFSTFPTSKNLPYFPSNIPHVINIQTTSFNIYNGTSVIYRGTPCYGNTVFFQVSFWVTATLNEWGKSTINHQYTLEKLFNFVYDPKILLNKIDFRSIACHFAILFKSKHTYKRGKEKLKSSTFYTPHVYQ